MRAAACVVVGVRPDENVEIDGVLLRIKQIARGDPFIEYLAPVRYAGEPSLLIVRFAAAKVLEARFDGTRMLKDHYIPGAWERSLLPEAEQLSRLSLRWHFQVGSGVCGFLRLLLV